MCFEKTQRPAKRRSFSVQTSRERSIKQTRTELNKQQLNPSGSTTHSHGHLALLAPDKATGYNKPKKINQFREKYGKKKRKKTLPGLDQLCVKWKICFYFIYTSLNLRENREVMYPRIFHITTMTFQDVFIQVQNFCSRSKGPGRN